MLRDEGGRAMHLAARMSTIRWRANEESELVEAIADALGWEPIEVAELLAGDFDPLPAEAKLIARAVAEFDRDAVPANRVRKSVVS